jgi:hypothetical protein
MWATLIPTIIGPLVDKFVDRIPNPNERARAKEEMQRELVTAVVQVSQQQARVNEMEAQHRSIFVAGWRPFIGWVCGIGLGYHFVIQPILTWALMMVWRTDAPAQLPGLDVATLYNLIIAMLGLGGMRMYEKLKGVSRESDPRVREDRAP